MVSSTCTSVARCMVADADLFFQIVVCTVLNEYCFVLFMARDELLADESSLTFFRGYSITAYVHRP